MRTWKAIYNVVTSLLQQLVSVICGFIVPAALIGAFGSEMYGAIGTITQYLSFISLLESGVGGVTRSALYKPLADKDVREVSAIVKATERFFRIIGIVFILYSLLIGALLPAITSYKGSWFVTFSLTLVISAGTLAQYFFGLSYSLLLQADQRSYVSSLLQVISTVANAISVVVLVHLGCDVVTVQAGSAVIYVLRPLLLGRYVRHRYSLISDVEPDNHALKDRWNGLGHHLAFYLRSNMATVALSWFAPLSSVAVFSVYNLVANGLQRIVQSFSSGMEAAFGNMIAKEEKAALDRNFEIYELLNSIIVSVAFSTAIVTIIPFISIYTSSFHDADYIQPVFSVLLLLATGCYCYRLPYNSVVLAAGHFRETRKGAFFEAFLCVVLSLVLAGPMGLEGVALALLIATSYRFIDFAVYASRNILHRQVRTFVFRFLFTCVCMFFSCVMGFVLSNYFHCTGYGNWIQLAIVIMLESLTISLLLSWIRYRKDMTLLFRKVRSLLMR